MEKKHVSSDWLFQQLDFTAWPCLLKISDKNFRGDDLEVEKTKQTKPQNPPYFT